MAEESDVKMGDLPAGKEHAELVRDAASIEVVHEPEERAVKRLKLDSSAESAPTDGAAQSVPGEGLHDAPANADNTNKTNGENGTAAAPLTDNRVKGMAPVKKEYAVFTPKSAVLTVTNHHQILDSQFGKGIYG
jgi:tRNA-dihydrouridine synthase 3